MTHYDFELPRIPTTSGSEDILYLSHLGAWRKTGNPISALSAVAYATKYDFEQPPELVQWLSESLTNYLTDPQGRTFESVVGITGPSGSTNAFESAHKDYVDNIMLSNMQLLIVCYGFNTRQAADAISLRRIKMHGVIMSAKTLQNKYPKANLPDISPNEIFSSPERELIFLESFEGIGLDEKTELERQHHLRRVRDGMRPVIRHLWRDKVTSEM